MKKYWLQAVNVALLRGGELPPLRFAAGVLAYAPLLALVLLVVRDGGFVGYLHGRFLLFVIAPFAYALLVGTIIRRSGASRQWRGSEFLRMLGSAMLINALLPVAALLALLQASFADLADLLIILASLSGLIHSTIYLRRRLLVAWWAVGLAVIGATALSVGAATALHMVLFPNPWEYLLRYVSNGAS